MMRFFQPAACRQARSVMLEGIEGRLDVRSRLDVREHVGRCGACAEELADLAAVHHALRRAFEPHRRATARVAPARARLAAASVARPGPFTLGLPGLLGRSAEHGLVFALLALAFVGTLPSGEQQRTATRGSAATSYVRAPDDPRGLVRPYALPSDRIPVADGLVIDLVVSTVERVSEERVRQGPLQRSQ